MSTSTLTQLSLDALKLVASFGVAAAIGMGAYAIASDEKSLPYRWFRSYADRTRWRLKVLFLKVPPERIVLGQVAAAFIVLLVGLGGGVSYWPVALAAVLFGPTWYLKSLQVSRRQDIEDKLDGFILTLANSLKATPSIGKALAYSHEVAPTPIDQELGLALKEMKVGATVDQALLGMSQRIGSQNFDATMAGMLIGRQVGGDVPRILETSAKTIREVNRLQGVLRSKTADARIQILVMMFLPLVVIGALEVVKPGYFDALGASVLGWAIIGIAIALWAGAVALAHSFLRVKV